MIWDQRQRHLAAPSLVESGSEAEQVLLFCTRSLTMEQQAFSMNFLFVFSCVSIIITDPRAGDVVYQS
jgi:hypothetical protein